MARHGQAIDGSQAIRGWPGPSADGLGPRMAPNRLAIARRETKLLEVLRRCLDL